jgi:hypothetical protein
LRAVFLATDFLRLDFQKVFLSSPNKTKRINLLLGVVVAVNYLPAQKNAVRAGLPDFSLYYKPKCEKYTKMAIKITNGHKLPKWQLKY